MLFSSLTFLLFFLPMVIIVHGLVPLRWKNVALLVASLLFYGWGEPRYLPLFAGSSLLNWLLGRFIEASKTNAWQRALLAMGVVINIGLLVYYKYTGFFTASLGISGVLAPALPLGISFFTFQAVAYLTDVYRRTTPAERSLVDFSTFILMFPQLIAGPIIRYEDVRGALHQRHISRADLERGMTLFIAGLAAKVLLANPCGALFARVTGSANPSGALCWLGAVAYGLQIYFDFAGYSVMAVGIGRMLGFRFARNFNHPYAAVSISDFWRRWHITLGQWFRDNVYIPLGGNRKGLARTCLDLMIVWSLTGLWHGASWNFLLWGALYGVCLIFERLPLGRRLSSITPLWRVVTLLVVLLGWVVFAFDDMGQLLEYLARMLAFAGGEGALWTLSTDPVVLLLAVACCVPVVVRRANVWISRHALGRTVCLTGLLLLCVASLATEGYNPFLYFRF